MLNNFKNISFLVLSAVAFVAPCLYAQTNSQRSTVGIEKGEPIVTREPRRDFLIARRWAPHCEAGAEIFPHSPTKNPQVVIEWNGIARAIEGIGDFWSAPDFGILAMYCPRVMAFTTTGETSLQKEEFQGCMHVRVLRDYPAQGYQWYQPITSSATNSNQLEASVRVDFRELACAYGQLNPPNLGYLVLLPLEIDAIASNFTPLNVVQIPMTQIIDQESLEAQMLNVNVQVNFQGF